MKTSELTGAALDWAVATCEGYTNLHTKTTGWPILSMTPPRGEYGTTALADLDYSTNWDLAGPIIDREKICLSYMDNFNTWHAQIGNSAEFNTYSPTLLIAAMRCYVASKLGDNIDIPPELM